MKRRNFLATLFAAPLAAKAIPKEPTVVWTFGDTGPRGNRPVKNIPKDQWKDCLIVNTGDSVCHGYSDTKELNIPINRVVKWENNKLVEM